MNEYRKWAQTASSDADVGRDARMMVPVFFDLGRRKTKVWAFLGWSQRPVMFSFEKGPGIVVTKNGQPAKDGDVQVEFGSTAFSLAYPVTAEVYVDRILDRNEFRRHCDQFKTRSAILKNLR